MAVVTMKSLLESGVHFGHQVKRWDPRMKKFIFAERNGIHIIDLQKTIVSIKDEQPLEEDAQENHNEPDRRNVAHEEVDKAEDPDIVSASVGELVADVVL